MLLVLVVVLQLTLLIVQLSSFLQDGWLRTQVRVWTESTSCRQQYLAMGREVGMKEPA